MNAAVLDVELNAPVVDNRPVVRTPDAAATVVFRTTNTGRSDLVILGPRTRAGYHIGKQAPLCAAARIRPGQAKPLLSGAPVSTVADRALALSTPWARRLTDELSSAAPESVPDLLASALHILTTREALHGTVVESALRALAAGADVRDLVPWLGIGERRLRTLFLDEVGLSPKHYGRIARVRRVLERVAATEDLARLAGETGFYDQAHMTTDFRKLMGVPPGAFAAGRLPSPQACTAN